MIKIPNDFYENINNGYLFEFLLQLIGLLNKYPDDQGFKIQLEHCRVEIAVRELLMEDRTECQ